jgi:hypothetical protein
MEHHIGDFGTPLSASRNILISKTRISESTFGSILYRFVPFRSVLYGFKPSKHQPDLLAALETFVGRLQIIVMLR